MHISSGELWMHYSSGSLCAMHYRSSLLCDVLQQWLTLRYTTALACCAMHYISGSLCDALQQWLNVGSTTAVACCAMHYISGSLCDAREPPAPGGWVHHGGDLGLLPPPGLQALQSVLSSLTSHSSQLCDCPTFSFMSTISSFLSTFCSFLSTFCSFLSTFSSFCPSSLF